MSATQEKDQYEPSEILLQDEKHTVTLSVNRETGNVFLKCSSRLALSEFDRSLLNEAEYGYGEQEYYPLAVVGGPPLVVNGARFTPESSSLYLSYPMEEQNE